MLGGDAAEDELELLLDSLLEEALLDEPELSVESLLDELLLLDALLMEELLETLAFDELLKPEPPLLPPPPPPPQAVRASKTNIDTDNLKKLLTTLQTH